MNGTTIGPEALKHRWREWCIVLVAGRLLVGRVVAQAGVPGSTRRLEPVYDFNSGFAISAQGIAEVHRAFPFLALTIKGIDLPDQGVVLVPFSGLDPDEVKGLAEVVAVAEELAKQQRAARSNIVLAPASAMPKMPAKS